ncbi:NLRC3 [Symbiodinium sp. CCMP2592]|nr:NLRC3 [Symbiodinium sp. CCMP2592]
MLRLCGRKLSGETPKYGEQDSTYGVEIRNQTLEGESCKKSGALDASVIFNMQEQSPAQKHGDSDYDYEHHDQGQKPASSKALRILEERLQSIFPDGRLARESCAEFLLAIGGSPKSANTLLRECGGGRDDAHIDIKSFIDVLFPRPGATNAQDSAELRPASEESVSQEEPVRLLHRDLRLEMQKSADAAVPFRPRLECWDFAGQGVYAQSNLLYFHGRGIYLVFFDASKSLDEAWREIGFWLWAVVQYARDDGSIGLNSSTQAPPIILVGTKWQRKRLDERELDNLVENFQLLFPRLKQQLQTGPGAGVCKACSSRYVFPIENFGDQTYLELLRARLGKVSEELIRPPSDPPDPHSHVGLQSERYLPSWLRAHDLLTGLGDGIQVIISKRELSVKPTGLPTSSFVLQSNQSMQALTGERFILPKGARVRVEVAQVPEDDAGKVEARISCTMLTLEQAWELLTSSLLQGDEVKKVLGLLHRLGKLFWFEKELPEYVLLSIRKVAVALTRIMSLRFWEEEGLQHSEKYKKELRKGLQHSKHSKTYKEKLRIGIDSSELRRLITEGIVKKQALFALWKSDFDEGEQKAMAEVVLQTMVQKGLIVAQGFREQYMVPCCLPEATMPQSIDEAAGTRYMYLEGVIPPAILAQLAQQLCKSGDVPNKLSPGPPQLFRNHVEFSTDEARIAITLCAAAPLVRIQVKSRKRDVTDGDQRKVTAEEGQEMNKVIESFMTVVGIDAGNKEKLVLPLPDNDKMRLNPARFFTESACSKWACIAGLSSSCSRCQLYRLIQERFLPDLSRDLAKAVQAVCVQNDVRPAGSFRFTAMKFPGDVDMEEYVIAREEEEALALSSLVGWLRDLCTRCQETKNLYWAGMKAGTDPRDPKSSKALSWSIEEIEAGNKHCGHRTVDLRDALKQGNRSRTAFITIFAKTSLFSDPRPSHFFEITNVIRFGHVQNGQIKAVSHPYDILEILEGQLHTYSGETPQTMKYVKRLWERAVYLAQRNMAVEDCRLTLTALQPVFCSWVARLGQIAAHAETLREMLTREAVAEAARSDVRKDMDVFRSSLVEMKQQIRESGWEKGAADYALNSVESELGRFPPGSDARSEGDLGQELNRSSTVLKACVECMLNHWLGRFPHPVTRPLLEDWTFPSSHLPIGTAVAETFVVCSWNVQNGIADEKSLSDSRITELREKRAPGIVKIIHKMIRPPDCRGHDTPWREKHILCLQGCWPRLLNMIDEHLHELHDSPYEIKYKQDGSDNKQAMLYDKRKMDLKLQDLHEDDWKKAILAAKVELRSEELRALQGARKLRIVAAHLPVLEPFGPARLCDFPEKLQGSDPLPTLLLGDFGFTQQASEPLLTHHVKLPHVEFVPIPYVTTIWEGSQLPIRTDCIASLAKQLEAMPLKPDELVGKLQEHVQLLQSRSLGWADFNPLARFDR